MIMHAPTYLLVPPLPPEAGEGWGGGPRKARVVPPSGPTRALARAPTPSLPRAEARERGYDGEGCL